MRNKKIIYSLLGILLAVSLILAGVIFYSQNQKLKVTFLDVGQGDAILISKGANQILIDGGASAQKVLEKLGERVPFWDRDIEVVLATHPDADHIGGLVSVVEKYAVNTVIDNGVKSESQVCEKFKETIGNENINELEGIAGMKIRIGDEAEMEILAPDGTQAKENPKDTNAGSIVSKLTYGENKFLFTGDISYDNEKALVDGGQDISANYLKISHHGSKYATSQMFLDKVKPRVAVVSVGADNRYGHPSPDVIVRLDENGIEIKRTDQDGDIGYECGKGECLQK
ncbi:MAG: Lactamase protein [Patescibacteria group bacterium]|nr:Lactamase protein [Patescibacteria group bacterium]